jgi:Flp pilus assembly protein protease CpaA
MGNTLQTSILISFPSTILCVGIVLLVVAAYGDIKRLRIPNMLVAAVAVLGVLRLFVIGDLTTAVYTVGSSVLIFITTFLLFWHGLLGGGDVKLLGATVLLVGYHDLFSFLFLMSICGALVSLVILFIHRYLPLHLGPRLAVLVPTARLSVPYGVAISGGAIVTLLFQHSLLG